MANKQEYIKSLIHAFANKTASEEQRKELLEWVELSPENKAFFSEQLNVINLKAQKMADFSHADAFKRIENQLSVTSKPNSYKTKWFTIGGVGIVTLTIIGILLFMNDKETSIASVDDLADTVAVHKPTSFHYSATDSLKMVVLPDSTIVDLNKKATISTPNFWNDSLKSAELDGNAFLSVPNNKDSLFKLTVGLVELTTRGAGFDIKQDTCNCKITVSVSDGTVSCRNLANGELTELKEKEQAIFYSNKSSEVKRFDNENHIAWKTGILQFDNTPLEIAIPEIAAFYGKEIAFGNSGLKNCPLNAKLERYAFEDVLKMFEIAFAIEVSYKGDTVILSGEACVN